MNVPFLGLRMKANSRHLPKLGRDQIDLRERVRAIMSREASAYMCSDYLDRRVEGGILQSPESNLPHRSGASEVDQVDTACREKMCEWSYKVCDHFGVEREIVAIAFSYLDRFMNRCPRDRTTFKLAAVTSLFMANKIFNTNKISLRRLVELSKGEFDNRHILEMEMTILQTLSWQVSPPTLQCYVEHLYVVLPSLFDEPRLMICVYQRAIFLAELGLYDSTFMEKKRSMLAVATVLNAIEGLEGVMTKPKEEQFLKSIESSFGLSFDDDDLKNIRRRLWYVYSMSAQCRDDEVLPSGYPEVTEVSECSVKQNCYGIDPRQLSPVCVITTGGRSYHTKP